MVYNGYYKVMSNIPKMGHLPTPDITIMGCFGFIRGKFKIQQFGDDPENCLVEWIGFWSHQLEPLYRAIEYQADDIKLGCNWSIFY